MGRPILALDTSFIARVFYFMLRRPNLAQKVGAIRAYKIITTVNGDNWKSSLSEHLGGLR